MAETSDKSSNSSTLRLAFGVIILLAEIYSLVGITQNILTLIKPLASYSPVNIQNVTQQNYFFNQSALNDGFALAVIILILGFLYLVDRAAFDFLKSL